MWCMWLSREPCGCQAVLSSIHMPICIPRIMPSAILYACLRRQADEFSYWNFFLDFGPLSLGNLFRFCRTMNFKIKSDRLQGKVISRRIGCNADAMFISPTTKSVSSLCSLAAGKVDDVANAVFARWVCRTRVMLKPRKGHRFHANVERCCSHSGK